MRVRITADSTCDLPRQLVTNHGIGILPLYIITDDGESRRDGIDMAAGDVFEYTARTGKIAGTSAVTVGDYIERWTELKRDGCDVVHISFSSELSACWQNAVLAAEDVGGVYVVDSRNLSTGYGHLVLDAAIMAEEGAGAKEIVAMVETMREKVDVSFVLNTLDYLRRGGRCTALAALGANMLGLKPCIEVHDGRMGVAKKYRGKIEQAFVQYAADRLRGRDDIDTRRVFITDSGISEEAYRAIEEAVRSAQPFKEIYHNTAGCTISGHCGPWCMGILYYHK